MVFQYNCICPQVVCVYNYSCISLLKIECVLNKLTDITIISVLFYAFLVVWSHQKGVACSSGALWLLQKSTREHPADLWKSLGVFCDIPGIQWDQAVQILQICQRYWEGLWRSFIVTWWKSFHMFCSGLGVTSAYLKGPDNPSLILQSSPLPSCPAVSCAHQSTEDHPVTIQHPAHFTSCLCCRLVTYVRNWYSLLQWHTSTHTKVKMALAMWKISVWHQLYLITCQACQVFDSIVLQMWALQNYFFLVLPSLNCCNIKLGTVTKK